MRKCAQVGLMFLFCLLCSCSYQTLTIEQIDELFQTDFSRSGLYRQDDEYLFSKEPVYHLGGNFFDSNYSGIVEVSKSDRVHVYPEGRQLISEEILELNELNLRISIVTKETIDCPDGFAEPYFLIEYETDQGFFGIRLTKKLSNLYAEGEHLKENDKKYILELIENIHFNKNDRKPVLEN